MRHPFVVRLFLMMLLSLASLASVWAQQDARDSGRAFRYASVMFGGGINDDSDRSMGESISFQHGWLVFSLRSIAIDHRYTSIGPQPLVYQLPIRTFDVGLMIGHSTRRAGSTIHVSALAGLAATNVTMQGMTPSAPPEERRLALGLPVELRVGWAATAHLGLGVTAFANYNSIDPFFGVMVQGQAGF
jgi:hypothetical protein